MLLNLISPEHKQVFVNNNNKIYRIFLEDVKYYIHNIIL